MQISKSQEIEYYQNNAVLEPNNPQWLAKLVALYLEANNYAKAKQVLLKLNELVGHNWQNYYYLGYLSYQLNQYSEAELWYQKTLDVFLHIYDCTIVYLGMTELFIKCQDFAKAKESLSFLNVANITSNIYKANYYKYTACINYACKQYGLANNNLYKALQYNDKDFYLQFWIVKNHLNLKEYVKAKNLLETIAAKIKAEDYMLLMARLLQASDSLQASINLLSVEARKLESVKLYTCLAKLYIKNNQKQEAYDVLQQALGIAKNLEEKKPLYEYIFQISYDLAFFAECQQYITKYLQEFASCESLELLLLNLALRLKTSDDFLLKAQQLQTKYPHNPRIYHVLANYYQSQNFNNKFDEKIIKLLLKALSLEPGNADFVFSMVHFLQKKNNNIGKKYAYNNFRKILAEFTEHGSVSIDNYSIAQLVSVEWYLYMSKLNGQWDDYDKVLPLMEWLVADVISKNNCHYMPVNSFNVHHMLDNDKFLKKVCQYQAQDKKPNDKDIYLHARAKLQQHKIKLRIGYISADFTCKHVIGFLLSDLFSYHNRGKFCVYAYSLRKIEDDSDALIRKSVDNYIELHGYTDSQAAELIYHDNIDILIDLTGYTRFARTEILAYQPAPVQAHMLGQTGTMGADYIQYYICTAALVPAEQQDLYTENLVYLPKVPIAMQRLAVNAKPTRQDYALPQDGLVFCCFNVPYRVDRGVFASWMQILQKLPNSYLWLTSLSEEYSNNLTSLAETYGIASTRVIFMPQKLLTDGWFHQLADVYLDTHLISGGTTAILSAHVGLPVLTIAGTTPPSCYGAAIMQALDIDWCVCQSVQEYINKAVYLGNNPGFLRELKQQILANCDDTALFKQDEFIVQLEDAYKAMWQHYLAKDVSRIINIAP